MTSWFPLVAALLACGCQQGGTSSESATRGSAAVPGESTPAPAPAKPVKAHGNATAAITLSGAIETTLSGSIGFCAIPMIGGKASGASFQISDGAVQLAILATSEAELSEPKIVLHTKVASYSLRGTAATANLVAGTRAEIDAVLEQLDTNARVRVKGTVTCN